VLTQLLREAVLLRNLPGSLLLLLLAQDLQLPALHHMLLLLHLRHGECRLAATAEEGGAVPAVAALLYRTSPADLDQAARDCLVVLLVPAPLLLLLLLTGQCLLLRVLPKMLLLLMVQVAAATVQLVALQLLLLLLVLLWMLLLLRQLRLMMF
jgi:hypothetical protein